MKTTILSIITALFLGLNIAYADGTKEVKIKTSAICEMCKARIERNLGLSKGVKESNLDLSNKVITVKYNPDKTTAEAIKATINKTGYDADELPANEKAHDKLPNCCRKTAAAH
ncbi:copper chaperone CopZ [Dyadobacter sp. BE34]|uniref:Copper chaperone CopZ n=1 Tax=Dyadobacter fermentans TaxID=94254 RepID=A0ABU1R4L6_9BACT|nr:MULTISPECIES: heavy metal-associated domain-containing protein [Dyadobacter]HWV31206.1 heavy metal-associated domain-containing protein [Dyadobacter sp.]MDR6808298.1 copper chaperone CopZ [Dyadobacter fermentans]MDR7045886.1 copper chaperone CopZ [Dyadobacter sp. BE242]MDR7200199.1 copper chaperone CopZ [Dyadobacter sp. BE34]MDR7218159.1 copper chaperone CopZ [Dyadobacter sp. BE31]